MKIADLLKGINYKNKDFDNIEIENVCSSFGQLKSNSLFVLIKKIGEEKACYVKGIISPLVIICEDESEIEKCNIPIIAVKDAREALAYIYSNFYKINYDKLKIIGVTGTNGKTTTATLIKEILKHDGKKTGFIGTGLISIMDEVVSDPDYSMTTPDPDKLYAVLRAMCDLGCEYAVMEVSSHSLALGKVAPIRFYRAVFTNLSDEHLDFHKDIESYFSAKSKLFKQCSIGIFNIDDKYGKLLYQEANCKKISCGVLEKGDCCAFNIEMSGLSGSKYIYREENFISSITLKLPGAFNIYNSLLAMSCCVTLGIKPCSVKRTLSNINEIKGRLNIIKDRITVIIDYAHTSQATEECLAFLSNSKPYKKKLTVIFGCGGERDPSKRPKMARSAQRHADRIIITSDNARNESITDIINDIITGFDENACYDIIEDRKAAIITAILRAKDGDIVAILGKGAEKYNITANGYESFDEKEIVIHALEQRKKKDDVCE